MKNLFVRGAAVAVFWAAAYAAATAQSAQPAVQQTPANAAAAVAPAATVPPGYVIGADDVLIVTFWRDKELSGETVVRPDGKISLPLLNDVHAAGYTPEQLAAALEEAATKYIADPDATVIVKQINSRKIFIMGEVGKPGAFPINGEMNVMQLIATAGGLLEYADKGNIIIVRKENGRERRFKFNYNQVAKGKNPAQNILLQPGDVVLVR